MLGCSLARACRGGAPCHHRPSLQVGRCAGFKTLAARGVQRALGNWAALAKLPGRDGHRHTHAFGGGGGGDELR